MGVSQGRGLRGGYARPTKCVLWQVCLQPRGTSGRLGANLSAMLGTDVWVLRFHKLPCGYGWDGGIGS